MLRHLKSGVIFLRYAPWHLIDLFAVLTLRRMYNVHQDQPVPPYAKFELLIDETDRLSCQLTIRGHQSLKIELRQGRLFYEWGDQRTSNGPYWYFSFWKALEESARHRKDQPIRKVLEKVPW